MSWSLPIAASMLAALTFTGCCKMTERDTDNNSRTTTPQPDPVVANTATPTNPATNAPAPGGGGGVDDPAAQDVDGLPVVIPSTRSKVPTLAEWDAVPREITVNRSTPLNCETKMVREWLRVSCREKNNTGGKPTNVQTVAGCTAETYLYSKPELKLASLVMPVLKGKHCEVRFDWTDKSQTLVVDWVGNGPRPTVKFQGPWP